MPPRTPLALALLLTLAVLPGCATFAERDVVPPEVHLANLALVDATLFEQELRVDLRIQNPNDFDLAIDGITFELWVNDDRIARGSSADSVDVPRLGEALMAVRTHTSSIAMVRQILNPPKDGRYDYTLRGHVYLEGLPRRKVPFERKGRLDLGAPPPSSPTI